MEPIATYSNGLIRVNYYLATHADMPDNNTNTVSASLLTQAHKCAKVRCRDCPLNTSPISTCCNDFIANLDYLIPTFRNEHPELFV